MYRPSRRQIQCGVSVAAPMVPPTDKHVVIETYSKGGTFITQQVWRKDKAEKFGLIAKN